MVRAVGKKRFDMQLALFLIRRPIHAEDPGSLKMPTANIGLAILMSGLFVHLDATVRAIASYEIDSGRTLRRQ